jgi:hypothetical protein
MVLSGARAGVVSRWVTPELADAVTARARAESDAAVLAAGEDPRRERFRALPARLGVYFVLGLCLYSGLPYRAVLGKLCSVVQAPEASRNAAPALTGLRRYWGTAGAAVLAACLAAVAAPRRGPICGLLASLGRPTVKAASKENIAWFGGGAQGEERGSGPARRRGGGYPQARLVALVACGTRAPAGRGDQPLRPGNGAGRRARRTRGSACCCWPTAGLSYHL